MNLKAVGSGIDAEAFMLFHDVVACSCISFFYFIFFYAWPKQNSI